MGCGTSKSAKANLSDSNVNETSDHTTKNSPEILNDSSDINNIDNASGTVTATAGSGTNRTTPTDYINAVGNKNDEVGSDPTDSDTARFIQDTERELENNSPSNFNKNKNNLILNNNSKTMSPDVSGNAVNNHDDETDSNNFLEQISKEITAIAIEVNGGDSGTEKGDSKNFQNLTEAQRLEKELCDREAEEEKREKQIEAEHARIFRKKLLMVNDEDEEGNLDSNHVTGESGVTSKVTVNDVSESSSSNQDPLSKTQDQSQKSKESSKFTTNTVTVTDSSDSNNTNKLKDNIKSKEPRSPSPELINDVLSESEESDSESPAAKKERELLVNEQRANLAMQLEQQLRSIGLQGLTNLADDEAVI